MAKFHYPGSLWGRAVAALGYPPGADRLTTRPATQSWESGPAGLPPAMEECAGNIFFPYDENV